VFLAISEQCPKSKKAKCRALVYRESSVITAIDTGFRKVYRTTKLKNTAL